MSQPIVFISHFRVRKGTVRGLEQLSSQIAKRLETDKPRTVVFLAYLTEDGTTASFAHIFNDAESMDLHFQGAEQRSAAADAFLEPLGWEVYGTPSDAVLRTMRQAAAASNVTLSEAPANLAGFVRLASG